MPVQEYHNKVERCYRDAVQKYECSEEILKQLISKLLSSECCPACVLRALDCQDDSVYLESHQMLLESLRCIAHVTHELVDMDKQEENPCSICLGLLQPKGYREVSKTIKEAIVKDGYDAKCCDTNVAIPTGALVRGKLFWIQVRTVLPTLQNEERLPTIKQILRKLIGHTLEREHGMQYTEKGQLHITIELNHDETSNEHYIFQDGEDFIVQSGFVPKWSVLGTSRAKISDNLKELTDTAALGFGLIPCKPVWTYATMEAVELLHDSLFIAGRYLKLERGVSQTPWFVNGRSLAEHSVSEVIAGPIQLLFGCNSTNFVTAGREDADVRMLGSGRPYALELCNPRKTNLDIISELAILTKKINSSKLVNTTSLQLIQREGINVIKEGEQTKVKTYRALVWVASPIPNQACLDEILGRFLPSLPLSLSQLTPLRVLHRRSALDRPKTIHQLRVKWHHPHYLLVDLVAEAGTYIKEFVHGDVGRTTPSLKDLLEQPSADLLELDVTHVDLEWPPSSPGI